MLLLHFSLTYHLAKSPLSTVFPEAWVRAATINGNYGVTVFFAVSGFLITSNALRRYGALANIDLRHFYVLRFARIMPPLLAALAIIVPLGLSGLQSFDNVSDGQVLPSSMMFWAVLSVLTFWHNLLMQGAGYFNYCLNIYWSLSVEECFYLGFPLACVVLQRPARIVTLCAACIVLAPLYRHLHRDEELYFMYGYPACFDAIALGCLAALASERATLRPRLLFAMRCLAYAALAAVCLTGIDGHETFGFTAVALCAAILLFRAFHEPGKPPRFAPLRLLAWCGRHSYELYLFHIIVLAILRDCVPRDALPAAMKLPWLLLFLALSAALCAAVSRWLAEPVNRLLRRRLLRPVTGPRAW